MPLTADQATFQKAMADLENADVNTRLAQLAGRLSAVLETVAQHGLNEVGQASLRSGLAWIAAESEVAERSARWVYDRGADMEPVRRSRFDIRPEDIDGYPLPGRGNS